MKVRITDLLDQLEDNYGTLRSEQADAEVPAVKETITVKQSKHSFGWKQGLSLAAALGVVVLGSFGIGRLLKSRKPQGENQPQSITQSNPSTPVLEQVRDVDIPLSDADQKSVNLFLTALSQQGITEFVPEKAEEYELASFVHLYLKLNENDKLLYRSENDESYETFTLEQANEVLTRFFGLTVSPAEGTDYTLQNGDNYAAHEQFRDGIFWFPAADGDMHTGFSVCDTVNKTEDGDLEVTFTTYNVHDIDDYFDKFDSVYTGLRIPEAEALVGDGELFKTMHGNAKLHPTESGWQLLVYEARILEDGPGHREDDEEFPEEYPVTEYRLEGDVFKAHGEVQAYRYEPLPMDDGYQIVLHNYAEGVLNSEGLMSLDADSVHDDYANWGMYGPNGNAFASGSDITGRFSFNLAPGFDKILEMTEAKIEDPDMMQRKAVEFAALFSDITGEIALDHSQEDTCHYHDERASELQDVTVSAITYYFRPAGKAYETRPMQEGLEVPVRSGDSNVLDLPYDCFYVTVWPDGTVISACNYITRAEIVQADTVRLPEEEDIWKIMKFMTSFTENDTVVITSIEPTMYGVYFGSGNIDPDITVEYYYASDPDNKQSTVFDLRGTMNPCGEP